MKKNLMKMLILVLTVTAPISFAADLVQFSAGQPAKAAEVNANFKALNDELAVTKNFSNLIEALKNAVGSGGAIDGLQVERSDDPAALVNVIET